MIGCAKSWKNPRIEIDEDPPKIPDVIVLHKEFKPQMDSKNLNISNGC